MMCPAGVMSAAPRGAKAADRLGWRSRSRTERRRWRSSSRRVPGGNLCLSQCDQRAHVFSETEVEMVSAPVARPWPFCRTTRRW